MGENDSCLWRGEYARAIVRKREREIVYNSLGIVCVLSREPLLPLFLGRSLQTAKDATSIVHGGTDIEVKYWHTGLLLGCLVVINDIAAFLAAASDVPVVAVKWKWGAMNNNGKYAVEPGYKIVFFNLPPQRMPTSLGTQFLRSALQSHKIWILVAWANNSRQFRHWFIISVLLLFLPSSHFFPLEDLLPRLLIQKVVNINHGFYMFLGCFPALASQSIVKLLRAWILPLGAAVRLWNRRYHSLGRQVDLLIALLLLRDLAGHHVESIQFVGNWLLMHRAAGWRSRFLLFLLVHRAARRWSGFLFCLLVHWTARRR